MFEAGDQLEPMTTPPRDRLDIAYMSVAMGDPNLVHLDDTVAAESGLPSVIAHGTFVIGYFGAYLSRLPGGHELGELKTELLAPVFPGQALTVQGRVVAGAVAGGGTVIDLEARRGEVPIARGRAQLRAAPR